MRCDDEARAVPRRAVHNEAASVCDSALQPTKFAARDWSTHALTIAHFALVKLCGDG
jgi:hypothetical protein